MSFPTIITERRYVRNIQPANANPPYRIAIITDAPSPDDENHGYPLVGMLGDFLGYILNDVGIARTNCLIASCSSVRPIGNRVELLGEGHEDLKVQMMARACYPEIKISRQVV